MREWKKKKKKRENGNMLVFKERMDENFPELTKTMNSCI